MRLVTLARASRQGEYKVVLAVGSSGPSGPVALYHVPDVRVELDLGEGMGTLRTFQDATISLWAPDAGD